MHEQSQPRHVSFIYFLEFKLWFLALFQTPCTGFDRFLVGWTCNRSSAAGSFRSFIRALSNVICDHKMSHHALPKLIPLCSPPILIVSQATVNLSSTVVSAASSFVYKMYFWAWANDVTPVTMMPADYSWTHLAKARLEYKTLVNVCLGYSKNYMSLIRISIVLKWITAYHTML